MLLLDVEDVAVELGLSPYLLEVLNGVCEVKSRGRTYADFSSFAEEEEDIAF